MIPLAILLTGELLEIMDWSTAGEAFVGLETWSEGFTTATGKGTAREQTANSSELCGLPLDRDLEFTSSLLRLRRERGALGSSNICSLIFRCFSCSIFRISMLLRRCSLPRTSLELSLNVASSVRGGKKLEAGSSPKFFAWQAVTLFDFVSPPALEDLNLQPTVLTAWREDALFCIWKRFTLTDPELMEVLGAEL